MDIKPIETHYNGYRFRSRLEARWAVFFDAAGIKYEYEPEGFEVDFARKNGKIDRFRYLPDFYLPDFDYYVEGKPSLNKLMDEEEKLYSMIANDGPLKNGLLVLGQIPTFRIKDKVVPQFALYKGMYDGVVSELASFVVARKQAVIVSEQYGYTEDTINRLILDDYRDIGDFSNLYVNTDVIRKYIAGIWWRMDNLTIRETAENLNKCFDIARKARFEHGETPSITDARNTIKDRRKAK